MKGKIISVSGIDGAGKTTQLNMLLSYYKKRGKKTASIFDLADNENYSCIENIKEYYNYFKKFDIIYTRFYLRSKSTQELINQLLYKKNAFFKTADAYQLFSSCKNDAELWFNEVIIPLYNEGKTFLFDRYFYDEILYRSLYNLDINQLTDEYEKTIIPPADYSFYLHLSIEEIIKRNENRSDAKTSLFNNIDKITELYDKLETNSSKFNLVRIEGKNSKNQILSSILNSLK